MPGAIRERTETFRDWTGLAIGGSPNSREVLVRALKTALVAACLLTATGSGDWSPAGVAMRFAIIGMVGFILVLISAYVTIGLRVIPVLEERFLVRLGLSILVVGPIAAVATWGFDVVLPRLDRPARSLPAYLVPCLLVACGLAATRLFVAGRPIPAPPSPTRATEFSRRLPSGLRSAELLAVEANDHYLRVHTDRGTVMIQMRLRDAINELSGRPGLQTHRSWWVARSAVMEVKRHDGRALLTLTGGVQVPVSRQFARRLREEQWY